MTVVNSREFASNQKKYYDLAIDEEVFIKRGSHIFHLICTNRREAKVQKRVYYKPDEDFNRSITMAEFKKRALEMTERIDKMYAKR